MHIGVNDYGHALVHLAKRGVSLCVICSRQCGGKGHQSLPEYEEMSGIPVHRVYRDAAEQFAHPARGYQKVREIARQFRPNLLFCSQQFNMPIAAELRRNLDIPIVLLVEFACDPAKLIKRRWTLGVSWLAPPVARVYWRWLSRNTHAIITSYIGDRQHLRYLERYHTPVYYVPWCNHIPEEVAGREGVKDPNRGVYVGSLSPWKNTDEFLSTVPILLKQTPVKEFVIVGPGPGIDAVHALQARLGDRVRHIESLPRVEALKLVQDSFFSYTPVKAGGWGFIGDSWGVRTPLIATHNEYELRDGTDALLADRPEDIHQAVRRLYDSSETYRRLQEGGFARYRQEHSAERVGDRLLEVFHSVLNRQRPHDTL
jgi:glycosyltransferase involved in cell wall biosynthesis